MIDPTFTNVNKLFVLSFKNEYGNDDENETVRISFKKYYVRKVETKYFNVKNKEQAYEQIIEMSKTNNYTTDNLLDYEYFLKHYKLIAIDLSKQIKFDNLELKQKINFVGRLEENATMFFIIENKEDTTLDFSQNSVTVI